MIQPEPPDIAPNYKWDWHDEKLALVSETGVRLISVVDFVPDWARGEPFPDLRCTNISEDRLDEFGQFLTELVRRYKDPPWNIHVWELRNEPDGTTPERALVGQGCGGYRPDLYAKMLEVAYQAIKSVDPEAMVLMGGLAYDGFVEYGGPFYRYFPDEVMGNGGGEYIDATNIHYFHDFYLQWERWVPHGNPPTCGDVEDGAGTPYAAWGIDLIAKMNHFRNRMLTCHGVDKPLWVTELAEHGFPGDNLSLNQQARYVIQGTVRGLAADAVNVTWFALVTPPGDPSEQGLLAQDFTPKPSFDAYQTMTRELRSWEYSGTLSQPNVEGYVFLNARQQEKIVAWAIGKPQQNVLLVFGAAARLWVVDRYGNATGVEDGGPGDADGKVNGSISLDLPEVPSDPEPGNPPRYSAEPLFITKWP
jgi:hypothetical protein